VYCCIVQIRYMIARRCRKILKVASTPPRLLARFSAPTSAKIITNQPVGALSLFMKLGSKSHLTDRHRLAHRDRVCTGWQPREYLSRALLARQDAVGLHRKPPANRRKYIFRSEFTLRRLLCVPYEIALELSMRKRLHVL